MLWWPPWRTRWFDRPRIWEGADEWCNPSVCLTLPVAGTFILFWKRPWREMPCPECWVLLPDALKADFLPGGCYEGGRVHKDREPAQDDEGEEGDPCGV